jgi:hypothetical protein
MLGCACAAPAISRIANRGCRNAIRMRFGITGAIAVIYASVSHTNQMVTEYGKRKFGAKA